MNAKLLIDVCIPSEDRTIPKDTILRIGRIMGDAVYVYFGVMSDPVLFSKKDLEIIYEKKDHRYPRLNSPNIREALIEEIQNTEILIPVERLFDKKGRHITKKEYGKILIELLCEQLKEGS